MFDRRRAMLIKNLYSVPYSITYNLNGGTISTENPSTYTVETSEFSLGNPIREGYTFLGWTMDDGDEYVFSSEFGGCGDRKYTARWNMNVTQEDVSNNIINLTIESSNDSDGDGIVDSYSISFSGSSSYERINLPIENLIVGQRYRLSFTESNNAVHGTSSGYYPAIYGFVIDDTKNSAIDGHLKELSREQGGLIAELVGSGSSYSLNVIDGKSLNGARNMNVEFIATAETMYWIWDFGLVQDGILFTYNFENIKLNLLKPEFKFGSMKLMDDTTYVATFKVNTYDDRNMNFTFDGESGVEFVYYPITGLVSGNTYTITFSHKFAGSFINGNGGSYEYGCGILSDISNAAMASKMSGISTSWLSNTWTMNVVSNSTESVTLTFTADGNTAYWIWNMANVSDTTIATINLNVTGFSAKRGNTGNVSYI